VSNADQIMTPFERFKVDRSRLADLVQTQRYQDQVFEPIVG
jgi:hypothetical protein